MLANFPKLLTARNVKSFLKFYNIYNAYIADATKLTAKLYNLTATNRQFSFADLRKKHRSFQGNQTPRLRRILTRALEPRAPVCSVHRRVKNYSRFGAYAFNLESSRTRNAFLFKQIIDSLI